jgi:heterodisulfide reductase subunit C2
MNVSTTIEKMDQSLLTSIDPEGKLNVTRCLQCQRCSSGCTMRLETDILPHQINRMAALGIKDELLKSKAIWVCASCQTCVSRCPMKVDTPAVIDALRAMAQASPVEGDMEKVRTFNKTMLGSIRRFGRVYEFGLMGEYKLRTRDFFSDLMKFPTMLNKGKMRLLPRRAKGQREVASIFDQVRRRGGK